MTPKPTKAQRRQDERIRVLVTFYPYRLTAANHGVCFCLHYSSGDLLQDVIPMQIAG